MSTSVRSRRTVKTEALSNGDSFNGNVLPYHRNGSSPRRSKKKYWRSWRSSMRLQIPAFEDYPATRAIPLLLGIGTFIFVFTWTGTINLKLFSLSASPLIPVTREFELKLSSLSIQKDATFTIPSRHIRSLELEKYAGKDFGELLIGIFEEDGHSRAIIHDYQEDEVYQEDDDADDTVEYYYAFDDDVLRNPYIGWSDDSIQERRHCRRTNWHRSLFINCNSLHELGMSSDALPGLQFLAEGAFKRVFKMETPLTGGETDTFVFKGYYYEDDYDYDYTDVEYTRMDVLVSERLTSSPIIADVYGYCGLSILSQYFPNGDLLHKASKPAHRIKIELNDKDDVDPQNNFTASEKLALALEMAESIAELHGFEGGVIVHNDIKPEQWLYTSDGEIMFNDFNRAEVMLWDEEHHEYCKYRSGRGRGDWRSPEEYYDLPLNEKIDVFNFGLSLYLLLTGVKPYYETLDVDEVQRMIRHGKTPYIDPRYKSRSYAEKELVEVMESCWTYEMDDRTDIFDVVKRLRRANQENKHLTHKSVEA